MKALDWPRPMLKRVLVLNLIGWVLMLLLLLIAPHIAAALHHVYMIGAEG